MIKMHQPSEMFWKSLKMWQNVFVQVSFVCLVTDIVQHTLLTIYFLKEHGCKNMYKKLIKLSKTFPELKAVASRCSFALKRCIKESKGDKKEFMRLCYLRIDHYCGRHTKCQAWKISKCDLNIGIFDPNAQAAFIVCELNGFHRIDQSFAL